MAARPVRVQPQRRMNEASTPAPASPAGKQKPVSAFVLFLLLFVVYNLNFRDIRFDDTAPARVLPFCLLLNHTLYLDGWIEPFVHSKEGTNRTYFLARSDGHWMSAYPIIMPLVITPLYIAPAWLLARQRPPLVMGDIVLMTLIDTMEKLAASLIAALSAVILYFALRKILSCNSSLLLTLIYGLAGSVWSISAQGLWRHGFTQLSFALLLWALWSQTEWKWRAFWAGLALAAAAANNPANVALVLPFLVYFALRGRAEFLRFFAPLAALGSLMLAYDFYFFGRILGGYPNPLPQAAPAAHLQSSIAPFWEAAAGLLISPNRGLLIYMPWTVFALWGAARVWRENSYGWGRYLVVGSLALFGLHSVFGQWWAGWCFGPRYMADLLPFLIFFLAPVWPRVRSVPALRIAATVAVLVAVWIQVIGAFFYPRGWWDGLPTNVDHDTGRLWDWKDTQINRTWRAGPAPPYLFYGLFVLGNLLKSPPPPRQAEFDGLPAGFQAGAPPPPPAYASAERVGDRLLRFAEAGSSAAKRLRDESGRQVRKTRRTSSVSLASKSKSWKKGSSFCHNSEGSCAWRSPRSTNSRNSRLSVSAARRNTRTWS
jgi:hypothetical protein